MMLRRLTSLWLFLGASVLTPTADVAHAQPENCHYSTPTGRGFSIKAEAKGSRADPSCRRNYAVRALYCAGSYCSTIVARCCRYARNDDMARLQVPGPLISEEWPNNVSESSSAFLVGVKCHGNYCDDVGTIYVFSERLQNTGACSWRGPFSDEGPNGTTCRPDQFVAGVRCSGRYCDNLEIKCCGFRFHPPPPPQLRRPGLPPPPVQ